MYSITSGSGALTFNSSAETGSIPYGVATDPFGQYLYVTDSGTNEISAYKIHSDTGTLEELSGSPFTDGSTPRGVVVDPKGKHLYVADNLPPGLNVSAYNINSGPGTLEGTGTLEEVAGSPFQAGTWSLGIATDPSGNFLYVTNYGDSYASEYRIDPSTGSLEGFATMSTGDTPCFITTVKTIH